MKLFDQYVAQVLFENTPIDDQEYFVAIDSKEDENIQQLVDDAAKKAGYTIGPVFHGTDSDIEEFNTDGKGKTKDSGVFFTNNKAIAEGYGKNVMAVYLNLNGPTVDAQGRNWNDMKVWVAYDYDGEELGEYETEKEALDEAGENGKAIDHAVTLSEDGTYLVRDYDNPDSSATTTDELAKEARSRGYDSITFQNIIDSASKELDFGLSDHVRAPSSVFVAFSPNQIKSADPITYDQNNKVIPLSKRFTDSGLVAEDLNNYLL